MQQPSMFPLVDVNWLADNLGSPDLVVLDASFFLPNQGRDAHAEYRRLHIPGALFFDIDAIADPNSPLPHMLPSAEQFADTIASMGIAGNSHVVAYDSNFFMGSARAWWMFRVFGHDKVSVLDGGLERWLALGFPTSSDESSVTTAKPQPLKVRRALVCDLKHMKTLTGNSQVQVVDARSPGRFTGIEPEPRAGVRSGHIPGSRNVHYKDLVDEHTRCLKSGEQVFTHFSQARVDLARPIVTTCGTGVTACILALALFNLGREDVPVYDGSWTEWGAKPDTPVELEAG